VKLDLVAFDMGVVPKDLEVDLEVGKLFDISPGLGRRRVSHYELFPEECKVWSPWP